jgi:hypothetical protein
MKRPVTSLHDLLHCRSGGVATTFGLLTPVLFMVSAAAIDYSQFAREHVRLQSNVDAAAIAAARELQIAKTGSNQVATLAESFVHSSEPEASVQTKVDVEGMSVTLAAQKTFQPMMGALFFSGSPVIKVNATAKLNGQMPLCLLALDRNAPATIDLEQSSMMTATGCMIYSNSKHRSGFQAKDNAMVKAGLICSAGGAPRAGGAQLSPRPETDCPVMEDPLRSRSAPSDGACLHDDLVVSGGAMLLQPGVYCKGLKITNGAEVTLAKGIYVIKDGPLVVHKGGTINGADVSIYLKGKRANLEFEADSTINLTASRDGPLAGLLIFDDPSGAAAPAIPPYALPIPLLGDLLGALLGAPPREHKILSDNAHTLHGTIYMPKGRLIIDASKPIADKSAYTVLVVQRIDLHAGPNLILNSDYSASDVPVPKGVGPYGSNVQLTN